MEARRRRYPAVAVTAAATRCHGLTPSRRGAARCGCRSGGEAGGEKNCSTCSEVKSLSTKSSSSMDPTTACKIPLGSADNRLVKLPKGVRDPESVEADQVYIGPGATNLVMTTSAAPAASSREAMWWISDQGVRYGIELSDDAFTALGVSPDRSQQAPWPLIRAFAPGPALTRADALVQHDSLAPVGGAEALPTRSPGS